MICWILDIVLHPKWSKSFSFFVLFLLLIKSCYFYKEIFFKKNILQTHIKREFFNKAYIVHDHGSELVFKRIFILDRIEYQILFIFAKLTISNNEYYSCCELYSNNIQKVQDIRIFEYFWIIGFQVKNQSNYDYVKL